MVAVLVLVGLTKKRFGHYAILKILSLRSPRSSSLKWSFSAALHEEPAMFHQCNHRIDHSAILKYLNYHCDRIVTWHLLAANTGWKFLTKQRVLAFQVIPSQGNPRWGGHCLTVIYSNIVPLNTKLFTKYLRRHPSKHICTRKLPESFPDASKSHKTSTNLSYRAYFRQLSDW